MATRRKSPAPGAKAKRGGRKAQSETPAVPAEPPVVDVDAEELENADPPPSELVEAEAADAEALLPPLPVPVRPKDAGLVRTDALQQYMSEVKRHPLLTREEEHDLAVRYAKEGDLRAAYRLVASNLRLVVKLAHEYHRNPLALLDLIQEGNIGLMQAVRKYDPDRGVKLSSYAAWWIRAYILRYIMDNWKMVKLGTTEAQRKLFFKLRQEQQRLLSEGYEASPKLLAERLNVTEQDVVEMDQRLGSDEVSLDAPVGGEEGRESRVERFLPSQAQGADERLGNEELRKLFKEKLDAFAVTLKDKDRYIYEKRLIADEPMTLQDIGERYGVSRERARQIEAALINKIREYLREQIPDFDMVAVPRS